MKETVVTFSQFYEDVVLYNFLHDVPGNVFYIDVGANHPLEGSVTQHFYDKGGVV